MSARRNILITGASGFIGGFLVDEALKQNFNVFVMVRKSTNITHLKTLPLKIVQVDFGVLEDLKLKLEALPKIHFVIHNAGLTRAVSSSEFFDVNFQNTKRFVEALEQVGKVPKKFIFVSSLAACGPAEPGMKISLNSEPKPITNYGKSKLLAEQYISEKVNFPYLIFRPTAVYGPGDKDFFSTVKLMGKGIDLEIGRKKQQLSFIYVKDLVRLIYNSINSEKANKIYFVSDGQIYNKTDLGRLVGNQLNKKIRIVQVPVSLAKVVAGVSQIASKCSRSAGILRVDKVEEMASLNWDCDIKATIQDFNFTAKYNLEQGMNETIEWYRYKEWLN